MTSNNNEIKFKECIDKLENTLKQETKTLEELNQKTDTIKKIGKNISEVNSEYLKDQTPSFKMLKYSIKLMNIVMKDL